MINSMETQRKYMEIWDKHDVIDNRTMNITPKDKDNADLERKRWNNVKINVTKDIILSYIIVKSLIGKDLEWKRAELNGINGLFSCVQCKNSITYVLLRSLVLQSRHQSKEVIV